MWDEILRALPVYFMSMLKFIFGPVLGKAAGLNVFVTMAITTAGMMTAVFAFTYFGKFIRERILNRFFPERHNKPEQNKKIVVFLKKYGMSGVALLTPVILTPIGGTLLAVGLGNRREKIIIYMLISASIWSVLLTAAVYFGYDAVVELIKRFQPL